MSKTDECTKMKKGQTNSFQISLCFARQRRLTVWEKSMQVTGQN